MIIRMACEKDAAEILHIYAPYIQNTTFSFEMEVPSLIDFRKRIKEYLKEAPWLVCISESKVVGYAYASPHRGRAAYQWNREVSVYVDSKFHRKGIAFALYTTLFDLLKVQGYANILAGITLPNPASEQFHQRMGFRLVGTYHNIGFKHGIWKDVNWYELFLQNANYRPSSVLSMDALVQEASYQTIIDKGASLLS